MSGRTDPDAVLIVGAYGTGKSALAAEMAELLEEGGRPYAAIDLDWLAWTNAAADAWAANRLFLRNLSAVVANDVAAGARFFVWPAHTRIGRRSTTWSRRSRCR
jgi:pantothenate kinase-related protein Tda10